ncbi:MAG TPA: dTDP-glucose 4,6-dehydratase [archaeon]|nr:dTDP-glucose 4,6-dehydratase [archaeon]
MRVLVTGGAGFIGSAFVRLLLEKKPGDELVVFDKVTYAGRLESLKGLKRKIELVKGDVASKADLGKVGKVDLVFNFAAESHVDNSVSTPEPFVKSNCLGVFNLLEFARKNDLEKFVQVSTDEVYGSTKKGSFTEESQLNPSSPYSATKASGDLLCHAYHKTYGLPVVVTRSSNNYGPRQFPEKLIPRMIVNALRNKPLPVHGTGEYVRDWTYVLDNCEAIELVSRKGAPGEVYNIASNDERSNIEVVKFILEELKKPESLIDFVANRPGQDYRYSLDSGKARGLGWAPKVSFEDGLRQTIKWYVENEAWWKPLA